MKVTLAKSPVIFKEGTHQYFLNGVELRGITGMLHDQLFPEMFAGISKAVLDNASARGTEIHKECEIVDVLNTEESDCKEAFNYIRKRNAMGWKTEASEYLVSDGVFFASCIDKVYRVNDTDFILADIKTYSALTPDRREYLQWQLSIYAYLFELCNPEAHVVGLYGLWLRDDNCEFVPVHRIEEKQIIDLMDATKADEKFVKPYTMPAQFLDIEMQIVDILQKEKYFDEQKKKLTETLREAMDKAGVISWESSALTITRKKDYTRKSLDGTALKKAHPDIYAEYEKESLCKGGVTIKIKN